MMKPMQGLASATLVIVGVLTSALWQGVRFQICRLGVIRG